LLKAQKIERHFSYSLAYTDSTLRILLRDWPKVGVVAKIWRRSFR